MELVEKQPDIQGLKLIATRIFRDDRGFFLETYRQRHLAEMGLPREFVQDNCSRSLPGVLRGLHFQRSPHAQGKLVRAVRGRIWDVAVDLRRGSETFGKHFACELSDQNGLMLWIPGGFAHGFCVLGEQEADVAYKVDADYNAQSEGGVRWNDPSLGIAWPVRNPLVSPKDQALPSLQAL